MDGEPATKRRDERKRIYGEAVTAGQMVQFHGWDSPYCPRVMDALLVITPVGVRCPFCSWETTERVR